MTTFFGPNHRARLLALVLGLGCAPSLMAQSLPFVGRWLPDDAPGAPAGTGSLTIKEASMTWRGPDKSTPPCVQPFVLKPERPGSVYTNLRGTRFVAGAKGSFPTYLLQLGPNTCGSNAEAVRISYPLVYDVDHIELMEYVQGKPVTSRRFRRKK